ncbi:hypothetical protein K2173_023278 [Erythroxylum novogranatense]|uniref:Nuclear condensin complex subunit 3 C-terminal domain-containing protein n=1 Tax=Erythroxylum novogranatense TaxID=1862640 RepID=A0AAV8TA70_9ROSI|nr:hypothetical protein K2173_023278 [Erythroxylum novogranatense]
MEEERKLLDEKIARILDDAKTSNATHLRKAKDLSYLVSSDSFPTSFLKTLTPLFTFRRRTASAERLVRFVSAFAATTTAHHFLHRFLKFLLLAAVAANKTARFRACQIISEIIMRLPDDAEVSDELWDEVIECLMIRVRDKVPVIRSFAVRALSRFVNDAENSDLLDLFLEVLPLEQNAEVRKTILLALPPSNATSNTIIDCTLDVSESVRKAAYCVIANKFPLQSLSIKLRTVILQRGLTDRSATVSRECLKLMKDEWLSKCCNGDPVELLKYLDVETYESVGESVMIALLKDGSVQLGDDQSIRRYVPLTCSEDGGETADFATNTQLMEPELALYWKNVCMHLEAEAQAKGSNAAATKGTAAAVYAAEASDTNDLLERILPATVSDYVALVQSHIRAGANHRFAARQLLLLGTMLDFSDFTSRKVASAFVQDLLLKSLDYEVDEEGNAVVIGDGINLGGDRDWAQAVSNLARKVHAATGEFEEVIIGVIEGLAQPCRERTADFMQWMHCLAVTGLLLESAKSFHLLQGKSIDPVELLHSLLLPGAKHVHFDVQRVTIRCLGLYGLLEKQPSKELVKQLRLSFAKGPIMISIMACKALIDLLMWHGPQEINRVLGLESTCQFLDEKMTVKSVDCLDTDELLSIDSIKLLFAGLDLKRSDWLEPNDDNETVQAILGEGFSKVLLLSESYPSISTSFHPLLLEKLINLYFSDETKDLIRLKQCLSVFFDHYPSLSAKHKKCLSKAFIPVMRSMWPGIYGNAGGSAFVVSNLRKRAAQASRFMVQMMQAPLYTAKNGKQDENADRDMTEIADNSIRPSLECGEEGLAIRIAVEVASFNGKKTPAERSYIISLCRVLVLLHFRSSEQGAIKLMRKLLNAVAESVSADKDLAKELQQMAGRLKLLDMQPDEELSEDHANRILGSLEIESNVDLASSAAIQQTPVISSRSTRPSRSRRRVRCGEETSSDEEISTTKSVSGIQGTTGARSQRASKTAALTKITASRAARIDEVDDDTEQDGSELTSEEDSDNSDHLVE